MDLGRFFLAYLTKDFKFNCVNMINKNWEGTKRHKIIWNTHNAGWKIKFLRITALLSVSLSPSLSLFFLFCENDVYALAYLRIGSYAPDMYKRNFKRHELYLLLCEDTLISFIIIQDGIKDVVVNGKLEL